MPALFAAAAALLFLWWFFEGRVGLETDSVAYIGMADNLRHGDGPTLPFTLQTDTFDPLQAVAFGGRVPSTHFPPLYPVVLALAEGLAPGVGSAAKLVAVLAVVAGVLLLWTLVRRSITRGALPVTALAVTGLVFGTRWLTLYGNVLSEVLFLPLTLAAALALGTYLDRPSTRAAAVAGAIGSAALLTRYMGLAVVVTGLLCIGAVADAPRRLRLRHAALFAVVSITPIAAFWAWGRIQSDGIASRGLAWHPQTGFLDTVPQFLAGLFGGPSATWVNWGVTVAVVAAPLVLVARWPEGVLGPRDESARGHLILFGVFTLVYLALLELARTTFDASTPIDSRLLAPVIPFVFLSVVGVLWRMIAIRTGEARASWVVVAAVGALLASRVGTVRADHLKVVDLVIFEHVAGSQRLDPMFRAVPGDAVLLASDAARGWRESGRPVVRLPLPIIETEHRRNPRYQEELCQLADLARERETWAYVTPSFIAVNQESALRSVVRLRPVAGSEGRRLHRVLPPTNDPPRCSAQATGS